MKAEKFNLGFQTAVIMCKVQVLTGQYKGF